jgi:hypothetical protein
MLILLGFFTVQGGCIIHSDIHRSAVNRVEYPVRDRWFCTRRFARIWCAIGAKMRARHMLFSPN